MKNKVEIIGKISESKYPKRGQMFCRKASGETYILTCSHGMCNWNLICLEYGIFWLRECVSYDKIKIQIENYFTKIPEGSEIKITVGKE